MVREDILGSIKNEEIDAENENLGNQTVILQESEETVLLKRGVKLPKPCSVWSLANDHFKVVLSNYPIKTEDLNSNIERMNNVIFDYFSMTCGEVDRGGDINLRNKYDTYTVKDLTRELKRLKLNDGSIREMKFVSRKLRGLLSNKQRINAIITRTTLRKIFGGMSKTLHMSLVFFQLLISLTVCPFLRNTSQSGPLVRVSAFLLGFLH